MGITPRALLDRPPLRAADRHYLEAFYELSRGRSIGEVPQPIALTDFLAYCELMDIRSQEQRLKLYGLVAQLDSAYLNHFAERRSAEIEKIKAQK